MSLGLPRHEIIGMDCVCVRQSEAGQGGRAGAMSGDNSYSHTHTHTHTHFKNKVFIWAHTSSFTTFVCLKNFLVTCLFEDTAEPPQASHTSAKCATTVCLVNSLQD